jgi:hypothetical protein
MQTKGSQERDGRRYADTFEWPAPIGRKAHDDRDIAPDQKIPNGWEAEDSETNGDDPMKDGGRSDQSWNSQGNPPH